MLLLYIWFCCNHLVFTASTNSTPSSLPSSFPSTPSPSSLPSSFPSSLPSSTPSATPSQSPSLIPTFAPSSLPSKYPSPNPTFSPSPLPFAAPSSIPSTAPTVTPTNSSFNSTPAAAPATPPTLPPTNSLGGDCSKLDDYGDGKCDAILNNQDCNWDGGDCCGATCEDGSNNKCGSNGYNCQDPEYTNQPTPDPTLQPTIYENRNIAMAAIALGLITLLTAVGLCYCFCKTSSEPNQRDYPDEKKESSCFKFGGGGGSSKPKFTQMRGSRKSKASQDERAIELARFERMSNRSDAYPKFGGSATQNPITAPPGSGNKFRDLQNSDMSLI